MPPNYHCLPDEILIEIFSRIPAKSVGKFRCLSKTWQIILSTPHFINSHLSCKTHQQSLILLNPSNSLHVVKPPFGKPTSPKNLQLENTYTRVVASCNGIVLLFNSDDENEEDEIFLVNPTTLEQFKLTNLPNLSFDFSRNLLLTKMGGFGYDSSTDDYKIVEISHLYENHKIVILVDVYSVKSGVWKSSVWKIIDHSLYQYDSVGNYCGVFTNGSIHWYVNHQKKPKTSYGILAFNLSTEVFYEVGLPLRCSGAYASCRILAHEMRLCLLDPKYELAYRGGRINVWLMIEYGNIYSWTKLGTFDEGPEWYMEEPLCFSRDKEIVLITDKQTVVCNLQEETVKDMVFDGAPACFSDGCSFVGSLVSLNLITSSS